MNYKAYGIAMALMLELVLTVTIGAFLASKLDKYLNLNLFIFIVPILALILGIYRLYKGLKKLIKDDDSPKQ